MRLARVAECGMAAVEHGTRGNGPQRLRPGAAASDPFPDIQPLTLRAPKRTLRPAVPRSLDACFGLFAQVLVVKEGVRGDRRIRKDFFCLTAVYLGGFTTPQIVLMMESTWSASAIPSFFSFDISAMHDHAAVVTWTWTVGPCGCAPCAVDPKSWKGHGYPYIKRASRK